MERERERVAGKAAGDERLFYTWPKVGLADEAGSDAAVSRRFHDVIWE
jgi:hypothetical protein